MSTGPQIAFSTLCRGSDGAGPGGLSSPTLGSCSDAAGPEPPQPLAIARRTSVAARTVWRGDCIGLRFCLTGRGHAQLRLTARVRVTFLTQYYPPEVGAPQARIAALARGLAERGDEVTVHTCLPHYPDGEIKPPAPQQAAGPRTRRAARACCAAPSTRRRTAASRAALPAISPSPRRHWQQRPRPARPTSSSSRPRRCSWPARRSPTRG